MSDPQEPNAPPPPSEALRALTGAVRVITSDPSSALSCFVMDTGGFLRSFRAYLLAAPIALLPEWLAPSTTPALSMTTLVLIYLLQIIAFPLTAAALAALLQLGAGYAPFVIVSNWATPVALTLRLPIVLLPAASGGEHAAFMLSVLIAGLLFWYQYRIARIALGASPAQAIGAVMLTSTVDAFIMLAIVQGFGG